MHMGISVVGWVIFEDIEITWVISGPRLEKKTLCSVTKSLMNNWKLTASQEISEARERSNCLAVIKWAERKRLEGAYKNKSLP